MVQRVSNTTAAVASTTPPMAGGLRRSPHTTIPVTAANTTPAELETVKTTAEGSARSATSRLTFAATFVAPKSSPRARSCPCKRTGRTRTATSAERAAPANSAVR
ncbi:MAG: hypothetical protein NVSMB65_05030 [Chloroflexota bacterium]